MFINTLNPILFHAGFITIRWYGLFLTIGIILAVAIYHKLFKEKNYSIDLVYDLSIWLVIGGLIGARLGHIIFYNLDYFLAHPREIIMINHGGLASHGMTIGIILTLLIYQKVKKIDIKKYFDLLIIPIPLLAVFIRLGNFFNSEIIGKQTDMPWGIYFPKADNGEMILRHASQMYESLTALVIFGIIYFIYKKYKNIPQYFITNLFLLLYFSSRFLLEFFKERFILFHFPLSMGQLLSLPFIIWAVYWFWKNKNIKTLKH
ncbi:MAG: prolipoprotein diacylglyceryl transferase [Candidatus Magasanikbacteria bacterium CG_4_10_14_0_2_um_filter_33_14]|uniref:Phosphatidylglycerol--prolipoprotein diacylglyceryl transferase n=1 Tax=Candidatus Magasanikbacteria bacterium CG_4_10_14_0_2_um_filter_33_14 TaxID=1974636 RepID=A0A2M7VB47_9BACT|nr:MAG: prolipoprotein diacylglyceryl transferase [Candidatus Magasanikbacteria bacterium CG_4_10_14_0_2_um_filter_33_14]